MEDLTVQIASAVATVLFIAFLFRPSQREIRLPGPSLADYFPGGSAHALYAKPNDISNTILSLSRTLGAAFQCRINMRRTVILSDPDDILHVLSLPLAHTVREEGHAEAFKQVHPDTLFTVAPEGHAATRKAVRDKFNMTHLRRYHTPIAEATKELTTILTQVANGIDHEMLLSPNTVDVGVVTGITTFRIIINVAFGATMSLSDRQHLSTSINAFVNEMMLEFMGYPYRGYMESFGTRRNIHRIRALVIAKCHEMIKKRVALLGEEKAAAAQPPVDVRVPDLLDGLLSVTTEMDTVAGHVFMFTIAGFHATNIALSWAIFEVCRNKTLAKRVVQEIDDAIEDSEELDEDTPFTFEDVRGRLKLVEAIWNETLRVHPPSGVISRKAVKDVKLRTSDAIIPAGSPILISARNAALDERYWPDPHTFNPDRWLAQPARKPGTFIPFGAGRRNCPGEFMATHEGIVILAEMLRRFTFELACDVEDIYTASEFLELPRCRKKFGAQEKIGVPVKVSAREC